MTDVFPEVVEAVAVLPVRRALLDAELVVFGSDGRADFDALRARALTRPRVPGATPGARACVFDALALDDRDVRALPLVARKRRLGELLANQSELIYVDHVEGRGEELLAGARKLGLEGVVAKKSESRYVAGRTGAWLKFKAEHTADFVVIGVAEPAEETFWRPGLVLASVDAGALRYAGRVAVGSEELEALAPVVATVSSKTAPCPGAGRAAVWLEPALVCEVARSGSWHRHAARVYGTPLS